MTRLKDMHATEKEGRLQEAITAVQNGEHTCHSAAKAFNVPRRTLYVRVKENVNHAIKPTKATRT
jgi:hypothetical protein